MSFVFGVVGERSLCIEAEWRKDGGAYEEVRMLDMSSDKQVRTLSP